MFSIVYLTLFASVLVVWVGPGNGQADGPITKIGTGSIRGTVLQSIKKKDFYAYRGIPYAKPPLGNLRFQPPQEPVSWNGVYDTTKDKSVCPQYINGQILGEEDCLFLYVYTPIAPNQASKKKIPVIAFFHIAGFAFTGPTYSNWKPERFMDYDVIMVFIGFRLGPLGFLSTNDSVSFGNYGLLDQNLALRWIQNNIHSFGGDPSKVTLMGSSAGAASVTFHQLSPLSRGLFRAAIAQSGASVCPWAIQKDPLKWARLLASGVNCPIDKGNEALVDCLKCVPAHNLIQRAEDLQSYNYLVLPWVPVVEDPNGGRFLTQLPITYLETGDFAKVPTIIGVNRDEAYGLYTLNEQYFNPINNNFYANILPMLIHNITKYHDNLNLIAKAVKTEYYDPIKNSNSNQTIEASIDFISDAFFKYGFDLYVRMLAKSKVPVYYYAFNYDGSGSATHYLAGRYQITHGDELYYQFYNFTGPGPFNSNDQYISNQMLNYWVNFVTNLKPSSTANVNWPITIYNEQLRYLEFYATGVRVKTGYMTQRMQFWENYVPFLASF